jgi:hypothetical protein
VGEESTDVVCGGTHLGLSGWLALSDDPEGIALAIFAALHGGLLLSQTMHSIRPLQAALDGALTAVRAAAS